MKRTLLTAILAFIAILGMNAQEYEYTVKDTQISREEFFEAYQHRFEYNQIRDTTLEWITKKNIEVAVFRTLTDEEKEAYIWTDYGIDKIGRFPTGEYIANLAYMNWVGAVFLNKDFRPDSTVIQANAYAVYSKSGIYVGCEGFDCDDHARLHFYTHRGNAPSEMKEIAVYINNKWELPWYETEYPEFEGLDFYMPMVWYKDALYCFGVPSEFAILVYATSYSWLPFTYITGVFVPLNASRVAAISNCLVFSQLVLGI